MRTSTARYSAAALAALFLLGPIMGYAHLLLVRHAQCPEHGELVHLGEAAVAPEGDIGLESNRPGAATDVVGSGHQSENHGHDHCDLVATRKAQAPLHAAGPALQAAATPSPHPIDDGPLAGSQIAIYRLAPKNSPPA